MVVIGVIKGHKRRSGDEGEEGRFFILKYLFYSTDIEKLCVQRAQI